MKVPQSIGDLYDEQRSLFVLLSEVVEPFLRGRLLKEWHFIGRIKERESFAMKAETGRFPDLRQMEDFYACTIVVRNMTEVSDAEKIISTEFEVQERRPAKASITRLEPYNFDFDHLRLYVRLKEDDRLPPRDFGRMLFEVQIKTYLQHAWSIATHDLIYKTDDVNWPKARIAYQVKAMLDHAETSIANAGEIAAATQLQVSNERFTKTQQIIDLVKQVWVEDPSRLPSDIRRLADTILQLTESLGIEVADLQGDLEAERQAGRGVLIETLSPFGVVVQTLLSRREAAMKALLGGTSHRSRRRFRVLIPAEVDMPSGIERKDCPQAIFIDPLQKQGPSSPQL